MNIALITRMSFKVDLTAIQLHCFTAYLEALALQDSKDFTVYILANSVRNYKGSQANKRLIRQLTKNYPFVKIADPKRFTYDVEIRLDYDDVVSHEFISDVIKTAQDTEKETFVVSYQPIYYDSNNDAFYKGPLDYNENCPSMVMALVQKNQKTKGVYDRPHNLFHLHVKNVVNRPTGFAYLQVHGENEKNAIPPKSYKL